MQHGATWCRMVQDGATWCRMVQDGARWCKMVQHGARWCNMVQDGVGRCKMVQFMSLFPQFKASRAVALLIMVNCKSRDILMRH